MNIIFLDSTAIPKHIPIPRPSFPHNWVEYEYTSAEQTIERAKDADIIITSKVILSREVLQQLPKLKLIAITATGTNNVDLEAAKELGVTVNVVNKTGGSGVVGHDAIKNAKPDGYTLGIATVEIAMMHHQGMTNLTYQDYTPITRLAVIYGGLQVAKSSPFNTALLP